MPFLAQINGLYYQFTRLKPINGIAITSLKSYHYIVIIRSNAWMCNNSEDKVTNCVLLRQTETGHYSYNTG
ncbi:hypothetical protein A6J60_008925 [Psychrobacter sp. FDAARGOS_221]|nr:hypothetical protein A6J60_008925 [Psychrobacter sp. FDAARGOS_221]